MQIFNKGLKKNRRIMGYRYEDTYIIHCFSNMIPKGLDAMVCGGPTIRKYKFYWGLMWVFGHNSPSIKTSWIFFSRSEPSSQRDILNEFARRRPFRRWNCVICSLYYCGTCRTLLVISKVSPKKQWVGSFFAFHDNFRERWLWMSSHRVVLDHTPSEDIIEN